MRKSCDGSAGESDLRPQPLLSHIAAAQYVGISSDLLKAHVLNGDIPWVNLGMGKKRPRRKYRARDLDAFVEKRLTVCRLPADPASLPTPDATVLEFMARLDARTEGRPSATRNLNRKSSKR